jgi:hypothetical protein
MVKGVNGEAKAKPKKSKRKAEKEAPKKEERTRKLIDFLPDLCYTYL